MNGSVIVSVGLQSDDLTTVGTAGGLHLHTAEKHRPFQAIAGKRLARGDLRLEALHLLRRYVYTARFLHREVH